MHIALYKICIHLPLMAAAMTVAAPLHAQAVADPTRPSAAWLAAQPVGPGGVAMPAAPVVETPGVHILVTGPTRRFAMVGGEAVRVGDTFNGSKLVAINADGVVWQRDGIQERTRMSPQVQKTELGKQAPPKNKLKVQKKTVHGEGQ